MSSEATRIADATDATDAIEVSEPKTQAEQESTERFRPAIDWDTFFPNIIVVCGSKATGKTHAINYLSQRLIDEFVFDQVVPIKDALESSQDPFEFIPNKRTMYTFLDYAQYEHLTLETILKTLWVGKIKEHRVSLLVECMTWKDFPFDFKKFVGLVIAFKMNDQEYTTLYNYPPHRHFCGLDHWLKSIHNQVDSHVGNAMMIWESGDSGNSGTILQRFRVPSSLLDTNDDFCDMPSNMQCFPNVSVICGGSRNETKNAIQRLTDIWIAEKFFKCCMFLDSVRQYDSKCSDKTLQVLQINNLDEIGPLFERTVKYSVFCRKNIAIVCENFSDLPKYVRDQVGFVLMFQPDPKSTKKEYETLYRFYDDDSTGELRPEWFDYIQKTHQQFKESQSPHRAVAIWKYFNPKFDKRMIFKMSRWSLPKQIVDDIV